MHDMKKIIRYNQKLFKVRLPEHENNDTNTIFTEQCEGTVKFKVDVYNLNVDIIIFFQPAPNLHEAPFLEKLIK